VGEEGYFKAVDKSFDSFNASLRVQKESCWVDFRLNLASRALICRLTSNGVLKEPLWSRKQWLENRTKCTVGII
jgi:hypothetical protein